MNANIKYWFDCWKELLNGEEAQIFPLNMMNPRIVLGEFADELEFNSLSHKDNRDFFYRKIKYYLEHDPAIKRSLKDIFQAITKEFQNPRKHYLLALCRKAQESFDNLEYFNSCVDSLRDILFALSFDDEKKNECALVSKNIYVELIELGYSEKYVQDVPTKIFDNYRIIDKHVVTNFPHNVRLSDFNDDSNAYYDEIKKNIDQLTDADRINALKNIANAPAHEYTYIFQIRGLRGNREMQVGPVLFYSPKIKKIITEPIDCDDEFFKDKDNNESFLNAAVAINTKEAFSGTADARRIVISALNILRLHYYSKAKFEVGASYVFARNGRLAGESISICKSSPFLIFQDSLEISDNLVDNRSPKFDHISKIYVKKEPESNIDRQIMASIHWFRRASEAESDNDKLLWYWITIENLLQKDKYSESNIILKPGERETTFDIISKLLPRIRSKHIAFQIGWVLRSKIEFLILNRLVHIEPTLLEKSDLQDTGPRTIHLEPFIDSIPELMKAMNNLFIIDQLKKLDKFYTDSDYAIEFLKETKEIAKDEILLIYRMRNKIVHNAEYEVSLLPYAISSARQFAGNLLFRIIDLRSMRGTLAMQEVIAEIISDYEILMEKIKSYSPKQILMNLKHS